MHFSYMRLGNFGALGNQLWEIASTIGIAMNRNGTPHFPDWAYQPLFNVPLKFFDNVPGEVDFSGDYLQNYRYFEAYNDLIFQCFQPSPRAFEDIQWLVKDLMKFTHWTAVHIRRANNVGLPNHHPVCGLDYFEKALDKIPVPKDTQLVVFSDEPDWAKQQSIFKDAYFAGGNDPSINVHLLTNEAPLPLVTAAYDLLTMTFANANIISNSTFSWWSGWLSRTRGPVMYPRPWYGRALTHIDAEATMIPQDGRWYPIEREIP